jgi:hypothetical protein
MIRLSIEMTAKQRQTLEAAAALHGKSVEQYALDRLFPESGDEERAWDELRTLIARRTAEGLAGSVSNKDVAAILDEEIRQDHRSGGGQPASLVEFLEELEPGPLDLRRDGRQDRDVEL